MIPARGTLEQHPLAAVLRPLVRAARTGQLRCSRGRVVKTLYLSEGRLIFATSTDADDRLGEMLLRKGLISYRALDESVRGIQAGKRQGTILVERGDIRAKDLVTGVVEQVQEITWSLFRWEDGEYEFEEGDLPRREVIVLKVSTGDLIMEGVRRVQSWGRIHDAVGGLEQRYRLAPGAVDLLEGMSLPKDELNLVAVLDGEMTVEEICGALPQSDFLVCRTLWGLWAAGVVDRVPQDTERAGAESPEKTEPLDQRGASVGEEVDRFNELHRFVYELVSYELRERAPAFFATAFARISEEHPALFEGVAVDGGGELDPIALRRNVTHGQIARYLSGLTRLLEVEVGLAREVLGERKAAIVEDGLSALRDHQQVSRTR